MNVKEVVGDQSEMSLDTVLTPELVKEGDIRDFMRALADARKEKELTQKDVISISVSENARPVLEGVVLPGTASISFRELTGETYKATLSIGEVTFNLHDAS